MPDPQRVIARALLTGLRDYPDAGFGTQWDDALMQPEQAEHFARVVLYVLGQNGLKVVEAKG